MTKTDNTIKHTDIKSGGWIARYVPETLHPYVYLARLDRPVGIWLLLLPGWWAIVLAAGGLFSLGAKDIGLLILFATGAAVMRAAGCIVNDLWDRELDAQVERTGARPLAAGSINPAQAGAFLSLLLCIALYILMKTESLTTILLGFLALPLIAIYPLMKRITWWPQLFLGIVFNFGALMGWSAVTGVVDVPALLLYAAGIFWTLGYDTIYASQDKEDDLRLGIKSSALKLGKDAGQWVAGFYAACWVLTVAAFILAGAGLAGLAVLPAAAWHFYSQIKAWRPEDPKSSLAIFRSNRDLGLIIMAAALLS